MDDLATLLYNVSYHLVEIGRYVLNFMINRTWRDTFAEHQNGHLPDPDVCPFVDMSAKWFNQEMPREHGMHYVIAALTDQMDSTKWIRSGRYINLNLS